MKTKTTTLIFCVEEVKVYPQTRRESRTYQSTEIPRDPPYKVEEARIC